MEGLCYTKFTLLLLLAASQLHHCTSQNFEKIMELSKHKNYKDAVREHPDIQKQLRNSSKALRKLWSEGLYAYTLLTPECNRSIQYIAANVSRLLPLLDATGKPGAGVLDGNTLLGAAYDECFNYNYTAYCYIDPVFITNLYTIPWKVGLCVPKYCTALDIAGLLNSTGYFLVLNNSIEVCTNSKVRSSYSRGAKIMIAVSSLFAALVLIGTFVDILFSKITFKRNICDSINSDTVSLTSEAAPLVSSQEVKKFGRVKPQDFITAFSLFKTVPILLATKQGPNVITSLNGIRVLSMFWVILGHTFNFVIQSVDNPVQFVPVISRFSFQAVANAYFSVDSFFFLSGVLVAYLTLREMRKRDGRFPFLHYYIHRYLRITPTYAFVLFFAAYLSVHLSYGPSMTVYDPFGPACNKYWWTNLIYINNLHPWKLGDECMGWAWFLANDMQFYIIAPVILISAYHCLPACLIITGVFLLSGFTLDALVTGVFDFQASMYASIAYNYVPKPNITEAYTDAIYNKPWDRISPYIVGLALGYILYIKAKFDFNKVINFVFYGALWVVAAVVGFWLVYGLYFIWHGHVPHMFENIIYITFGRYLWASSLALIVFACHNGYGYFINSFLSMKLWTPLARMTFNAYLIHPVVIIVVYGQLQNLIHYTDISLVVYYVAFIIFSYAAAGVICLAVELPLGSVEMLIFKLFGSKGRESQRQDTIKAS